MRRRVLLASASGGGSNLTFPITLVEGDNGQIGVELFKYVYSHVVAVEGYDTCIYRFKDGELVTSISPEGTQFQILEFQTVIGLDTQLVYRTQIDGWITLFYLESNGNVRILQL